MFEAHVLYLLRQYLGEYVHGLSAEALQISVWKGDVVLKDLQLKAEALNSLKLPLIVKAGFLGSVTIKVPWNRLGNEPVVVLLDRIFILAVPEDERSFEKEDKEKLVEAKRRQIEEAELTTLEAKKRKITRSEDATERSSWLGSLIATIIGNLKVSITNVHIRYEDSSSNPGKPFCAGITLSKLAAVTIDDNGVETFVATGALDKLRKSLQLQSFAIYFDSNCEPWKFQKNWEEMTPQEWSEIFKISTDSSLKDDRTSTSHLSQHQYLLQPVNGMLRYHRCGKQEKRASDVAFQNISLVLNDLSLTVSEGQYCDVLKLLERVSRYKTRIEFSNFRPQVSVQSNARAWWLYACQAEMQKQKKMWNRLSWKSILHLCQLRRRYVHLYVNILLQNGKADIQMLHEIEAELDGKIILLWRLLAHAKVESLKSKVSMAQHENTKKSTWWPFGWGSATESSMQSSNIRSDTHDELSEPGHLTKEEWNKINELLSYQPGADSPFTSINEGPNMLQLLFEATVTTSAVRIIDNQGLEVICGAFRNLNIGLKLYEKTTECNLKLQFYGLSAPEGCLIESISREGKEQALTGTFIHHPLNENLDWKLSASISPCHVTVFMISFERFMQFLRSGHSVSPDIALETATALQNKLEQVTRRAQEQLQLALEEQSRFVVDLDLDAPKIRIPICKDDCAEQTSQLLLDLGHFTLRTADDEYTKDNLYSCFYISGKEMAAFFVNGVFEWSDIQNTVLCNASENPDVTQISNKLFLPVLDPCKMSIMIAKLGIPHPSYPQNSVVIEVPNLCFHFSPSRYSKLLQLLSVFDGSNGPKNALGPTEMVETLPSWHPADRAGKAKVLCWKGLGNTVAEWQQCWCVLAGLYLYILESENAQTYQRYASLSGKQVIAVPPSSIGGSEFVIVVCNRSADLQKALESSSTIILQFKDEECKMAWMKYIVSVIYRPSAHSSLSLPEALFSDEDHDKSSQHANQEQPLFFLTGSLHSLKVPIYVSMRDESLGVHNETRIIELQAGGAEVHLVQWEYDLTIGMKLHTFKIEDKLQGGVAPSCKYLARSLLGKVDIYTTEAEDAEEDTENYSTSSFTETNTDEDSFKDAVSDFGIVPDFTSSPGSHLKSHWVSLMKKYSALRTCGATGFFQSVAESSEVNSSDFVSMQLIMSQIDSPTYDGVDTQISMRMATLDFFCNRPTVVALIDFGTDLSEIVGSESEQMVIPSMNSEGNDIVKGLLGTGKSRVVFLLTMNVNSVRIFLNKEDGSQLAMLAQESFLMDLKVFPASFTIDGSLGNLRVCDMSLGPDHQWGWFCDIRDPGCDSLVKVHFKSYSDDENDYQGFDYSLCGKFSAVRIVFLYRFIQEITVYFTALASPQTQKAIRVVDKVGGIEKFILLSDIDGSPAVKLDISLDTPILVMPRHSASNEFMQLDLGHLQLVNSFIWRGGEKDVGSAVHLDVLLAEITGINMVVGIDGVSGKNMIQEARGLHVKITRPLRDLFKKVPDLQVEVQVEMVKGIMSDKEYLVITDCTSSNIAELPNLPPYFRNIIEPYSGHDESLEAMESTSTDKKDPLSTWTVNRFIVEVEHAELQLYTGVDQDMALACVKLEGLWLGYRSTSTLETDLYVTLPKISVLDLRTDTKPEMRLMLGPMSDIGKEETLLTTTYDHMSSVSDNTVHHVVAVPHVSMLIMDLRSKPDSQEFVLRIQCPRLLVVVDFLLDVTDFFVPTLSPTTGKQEAANVQNDPFFSHRHVRLNQSLYRQQEAEVTFSDVQKLIVDAAEVDNYIYDGCGGVMYLDIPELTSSAAIHKVQPIIIIGPGKRLCFKNITIKNGLRMQEVVQLSCNSAYNVSPGDGVKLEGSIPHSKTEENNMNVTDETNAYSSSLKNTENVSSQGPINFIFDIQAVAPELTFYDSAKWSSPNFSRQERLLRARMDLNALYVHKGNDKWIRIFVKGLYIEGGSGLTIVDPLDITAEYACVKEKTSIVLSASDINIRLSFTLIRLMIHLHRDVVSKFQFGGFQAVAKCTHFDQIWINNSGQKVAFWRPKPPEGYAILGDCITSGGGSPSQAVMAVNKIYNRVKRPTHFELIWCFTSDVSSTMKGHDEGSDICCIWRPVPAPGYAAIGCVANLGIAAPPLSTVYCIRSDLLTSASINDCVFYLLPQPGDGRKALSIWRVDNIAGSFFAHQSTGVPSKASLFDLNQMMHQGFRSPSRDHDQYKADDNAAALWNSEERPGTSQSDIVRMPPTSGYKYATVVQCERMWWDRSNDRNPVSIWRPIPLPGYGIVADQLVEGLEPPNFGLVVQDGGSGQLARPVGYVLFMQWLGKGNEDIYVWYPRASEGYVALGCVVTKTQDTPPLDLVFCVRSNLVNKAIISKQAVWSVGSRNNQNSCSIWKVENQVNSFLARPNLERPSGMAFCLSEAGKTGSAENLIGKTKIGRLSITVYDDLNGLMTPLLNVTITGLNLAAHGYAEALNAVLLSEITASTFNTHLETWEPFIESFEAIMKYESHDEASREIPLRTGKRVRITAPNVLNINATSANLEAFIGGYVAWRKQSDMEQQALSAIDSENCEQENSIDYSFAESALVQDNSEKIVLENRLGTNLFLRTFEQDDTNFQILGVGESTVACLPPSKFPDKMNSFTTNMAASRQHIVIHVLEAKELPIIDDCNGQEYFCSLRFINYNKSGKDSSVPDPTARSRCVKISDAEKPEDPSIGLAIWNEVFIFDMPQEGSAKLELFVSNQAAGGGKGEVIGTIRLPINEDTAQKLPCPSSLWRNFQQSVRGAHTSATALKGETFTLKSPKSKATNGSSELEKKSYGLLTISIQLLVADSNCPATEAADVMSNYPSTSDVGLWVGLSPNGQWTSIRSLLPVGTVSKNLNGTDLALEVTMQHDRKHAVLRSIVMFSNETDIVLEACVCPIALLNTPDESLHYSNNPKSEVDEIFENQRFQPLLGWGSKWPGHLRSDPGRWSNCDYSNSSQSWEVLEPPLTPGWITMSDWSVDKTGYVDENGWAYGLDFQSLKWPALPENSSKKPKLDFVRRRRWFRIRQQVPENIQVHSRHSLGFVDPGSSMPLPFAYTAPHTDFCLQVRPQSNSGTGNFTWGRAVGNLSGANNLLSPSEGSQSSKRSSPRPSRSNTLTSLLMLNQLEKMEELLLCLHSQPSSTVKGHSWLSLEADVNILYNDLSSPIYDCKLSVNAPLKIENLLPCAAEYCVWEKKKEIGPSSAERGVVKPGESVYIYTVDIRQPIYATWLIQGGWKPEKDHVLISGPNFDDLPAGLSLIHQQTHRRLQIRLERDFNRSFTKSVRLFVPYWLSNKASLPLSFQLVELDSSGGSETDIPWLIRAVKDAKQATSRASHSHNKMAHLRRVTQYLEYIEESGGNSLMLSPQAQSNKGSFSPFSPRPGEYMLSSRLGFSVSISKFTKATYGVSFRDLEDTQSIDLKAKDAYGAYYKLSVFLDMSSARTKVINIQPHSLFVNRLGQRLCVRQHDFEHVELIYPHDPPKIFLWQGQVEEEMLSICVDGFNWSNPFSIDSEGIMHVGVNSRQDGRRLFIRVEVRNGVTDSRYLVLFRHVSYSSPYRIENLSVIRPVRIRQTGGNNQSWQFIMTGSAIPFAWEDLHRTQSLDLLIDGEDPKNFSTYDIDTAADHQPNSTQGRPVAALHVSVFKEGTTQVVRVADWTPSDEEGSSIFPIGASLVNSSREIQLHISVELAEFGLSIVDHTPEELLYFSFQNLIATYGTGLGSRTSRFKLRIDSIQVDNQLPLTPMPVLFRPLIQGSQGNSRDPLFKCTVTMQEQISTEHLKFSYIGIQGPPIPNIVFSININEPIIWRLHYLIERLNMGRLQGSQTTDVALDPIVGIGLLNLSEIKIRVSLAMSPTQRPQGVLGFWSSLMTALGNTDDMPIKITRRVKENISMRKSTLIATAVSAIKKDLLSHPLQLLSGVDILGNASTALGHMSKGVAALSMDKKFIQGRRKQESKASVEGFGDGFREGAEAFGKGLFRGVTGIITKPYEGAKSSGVEGFVQGVGKGIIGAAAQPVSGVLDLLSKTTEGANAMRMKISAAITSEEQLSRRRLPRAIGSDYILYPYDEYKATGQILMQLAVRGSIFGPVDFFKVRGKYAMTDKYEDHFSLPGGKTLIITNRRAILLQHPTSQVQRQPDLLRNPCTVQWDMEWIHLTNEDLISGEDNTNDRSQLVLHSRVRPQDARIFETKDLTRIIKCCDCSQASQIYVSIEKAKENANIRGEVFKPYAGSKGTSSEEASLLCEALEHTPMPELATFGPPLTREGKGNS